MKNCSSAVRTVETRKPAKASTASTVPVTGASENANCPAPQPQSRAASTCTGLARSRMGPSSGSWKSSFTSQAPFGGRGPSQQAQPYDSVKIVPVAVMLMTTASPSTRAVSVCSRSPPSNDNALASVSRRM